MGNAGQNLITVRDILTTPKLLITKVEQLAGPQLLVDRFFTQLSPDHVTNGTLVYTPAEDGATALYVDGVEERAERAEYPTIAIPSTITNATAVQDWGAKFSFSDEQLSRNDRIYFDNAIRRLANTLARKASERALGAVDQALTDAGNHLVLSQGWAGFDTDSATPTPAAQRPAAAWAEVIADAQSRENPSELNRLLVHPRTARDLRVGYGERLAALLESYGLELLASPLVDPAYAYLFREGGLGYYAHEKQAGYDPEVGARTRQEGAFATLELWREPRYRSSFVQAYSLFAAAVSVPGAGYKISGVNLDINGEADGEGEGEGE